MKKISEDALTRVVCHSFLIFTTILNLKDMNKQKASQIIQAYQDYRHWDDYSLYPIPELDELNDALDLAIKELWKPDENISNLDL